MRAILSFAVMLLCTTAILSAQESAPKVEVFGGYSYANTNAVALDKRANLNGWEGSLAFNFNRRFGIVTDFSGHYGLWAGSTIAITCVINRVCSPSVSPSVSAKTHTFLLGPQVSFRAARATPFAHVLVGGAHTDLAPSFPASDTTFATALGGGLDYTFTYRLAWRVQADYLQTHFFSGTQNDFRFSTGPVFRFGGK